MYGLRADVGSRSKRCSALPLGSSQVSTAAIVSPPELGQVLRSGRPTQLDESPAGTVAHDRVTPAMALADTPSAGSTKTGNAHLRRIVIAAAWAFRAPAPRDGRALITPQASSPADEVNAIAWKAQHRLHRRYSHPARIRSMINRSNNPVKRLRGSAHRHPNTWASSGPWSDTAPAESAAGPARRLAN